MQRKGGAKGVESVLVHCCFEVYCFFAIVKMNIYPDGGMVIKSLNIVNFKNIADATGYRNQGT